MWAILFGIMLILIYCDWSLENDDRKFYKRKANQKGERLYQDGKGKWWYDNTKCVPHFINGHEVLSPITDLTVVLRDFTLEKAQKQQSIVDGWKAELISQIEMAKQNGERYFSVHINGMFLPCSMYCETESGYLYVLLKYRHRKYVKAYYEIIWPSGDENVYKLHFKCVGYKELFEGNYRDHGIMYYDFSNDNFPSALCKPYCNYRLQNNNNSMKDQC